LTGYRVFPNFPEENNVCLSNCAD